MRTSSCTRESNQQLAFWQLHLHLFARICGLGWTFISAVHKAVQIRCAIHRPHGLHACDGQERGTSDQLPNNFSRHPAGSNATLLSLTSHPWLMPCLPSANIYTRTFSAFKKARVHPIYASSKADSVNFERVARYTALYLWFLPEPNFLLPALNQSPEELLL